MVQTAALLKPNQKVINALIDYVHKILDEPISDQALKATLISESMQKYGVNTQVLAEALGYSIGTVTDFLNQKIDPGQIVDFHSEKYKEIDRAKVERQIKSIKNALNLSYRGGMPEDWYIHDMSEKLAIRGIGDLNDFGSKIIDWIEINPGTEAIDTESIPTKREMYFSKSTGKTFPLFDGTWESAYEGKGGALYKVKFTDTGLPVFFIQHVNTSFVSEIAPILPIIAIAGVAIGLPVLLGNSILGAVGVTVESSAVSATIGNVAINTVLTGGDISSALTKAATGAAGGFVGDFIGTGFDSVEIGKIASASASAAITGKNPKNAAAFAALNLGITNMGEDTTIDFNSMTIDTTDINGLTLEDLGIDLDAVDLSDSLDLNESILNDSGIDITSIVPDDFGNLYTQTGEFVELEADTFTRSFYVDSNGNVRAPSNQILIDGQTAASMTDKELADLLYEDCRRYEGQTIASAEAPDSRPAALPPAAKQTRVPTFTNEAKTYDQLLKTAVSIGASIKAIASGTFRPTYAMSAYGTPRVQAVGVPIQQPDGSVITNNGNGTQTIRYPNGQVVTKPTSFNGTNLFGGISTQTLLIGGGVLLAALLLVRRK
jgi:hypothetical protein